MIDLVNFSDATGANPGGELLVDDNGNLFGPTSRGGPNDAGDAFELSAGGHTPQPLANLFGNPIGGAINSGLVADAAGNLYGTTAAGGDNNLGTVYELVKNNNYALTILHSFDAANGATPYGELALDGQGNLYGTTSAGNTANAGTAYELSKSNNFELKTLVAFGGVTNGPANSRAGLNFDAAGNLYGTSRAGGANGGGTIFKLSAADQFNLSTVVSFDAGSNPFTPVTIEPNGDIYGTTGTDGGSIYKIAAGTTTPVTLSSFAYDPANPLGPEGPVGKLLIDAAGNIFGTSGDGGSDDRGTVYELPAGSSTAIVLFNFNPAVGYFPHDGLSADAAGNLYGVTGLGGDHSDGVLFEITDSGYVVPEPSGVGALALVGCALRRRRSSPR